MLDKHEKNILFKFMQWLSTKGISVDYVKWINEFEKWERES